MDQSRCLEEGLAQDALNSDSADSPTDTLCEVNIPESFEKEFRSGSDRSDSHNATKQYAWWSTEPLRRRCLRWLSACYELSLTDTASIEETPDPVIVRSLEKFKRGYPNLAAFNDSDESYMIYRRFGYLQARVLLIKQDEMRVLECRLDELDHKDKFDDPEALMLRKSDEGHSNERRLLLKEIECKYLEYANLLTTAHQLAAFNKPGPSEYESVLNYMDGMQPVHADERSYINHREDLVSLRPGREHAWLDTAIEKLLKVFPCRLFDYWFCDYITKLKTSRREYAYYSRGRIEQCAVSIITVMILALLIVPIWLLYHIVSDNITDGTLDGRSNAICIGVLLVFTLAFSAMMSFMTRAQRHEILGAAAAYCAVLVVFLGNVGNN